MIFKQFETVFKIAFHSWYLELFLYFTPIRGTHTQTHTEFVDLEVLTHLKVNIFLKLIRENSILLNEQFQFSLMLKYKD